MTNYYLLAAAGQNRKQQGVTLIVTLIILIVATLLVLSGVTSGTLSFRVATNMQHQREAAAVAQAAIDARLGNTNYLNPAPTATVTETIGAYSVSITPPKCLGVDTSEESGKKTQVGVEPIPRYIWEYSATATNTNSGVSVTIVQGVRLQTSIGAACPN